MDIAALGFEVREEKGCEPQQRVNPKHYDRAHPPGHVALNVKVPETASVWAGVVVGPAVVIPEYAILRGPKAVLRSTEQILVIGPVGRSRAWLTALFVPGETWINRGCFCGSVDEFLEEVRAPGLGQSHRWVYERLAEFVRVIARERAGQ